METNTNTISSKIFSFFKAQKEKPITKSTEEIDDTYKKMRLQMIATTFTSYVVFYITRKNFSYAMPIMMKDLGFTATDFGVMSTLFYIIYGLSKFSSGILTDKANCRAMTGPALIIIGFINLIFGNSSSIPVFISLYCLNALFQGSGFPPMAKTLANWFSKKERGTWWSIWNASHNVGGALAPIITSYAITMTNNWRWGFYIPGIISIIMGIIALITMRDTPRSEGLPSIGEWRHDDKEMAQVKASPKNLSTKKIFVQYILKNPFVWLAICGDLGIYVIRTAINDWTSIYYVNTLGWDLLKANSLSSWFEIGGILGGLTAGILSDSIFKGNRWKTNLFYAVLLVISLLFLPIFAENNFLMSSIIFFIIGAALYGPQMLYAIGLIEIVHKDGVGAVTGLKGLITYIGAAMAGLPVALIKNHYSWSGVYILLIVFSGLIIITLLPLIFKDNKKCKLNEKTA
ncbi:MFS transporter, OPA family, sugar phosphate sensor protein UhpC [Cetobacterium ceti]|uniref:MFS transporter, OPA family, sugar phosphate sensor protein UhpC n=1 Tax=Cetobacterium ceti TaxID=180163 RepID=A0A1T4NDS8_9FUSO|nr:MFS transporter [Cetobacterium ceti]SJZ77422.1 MFS transporter, OPA family, sugar phosphate sensor protein UhpC [Cetobacterium ceti]